MTFNGTSAAYLVAFAIAAARAAFSSADSLGNANASITSVNAAVSSSTNASNSSLSCCAVTAQLLKYSSLSSQPRFPADRFATIPPNEAPSAPINAATEPPPGAGESLRVSLQNSRVFLHKPTNRLHVLKHSGNPDRLSIRIQHRFSRWRSIFGLYPPLLSHIKRNRVCAPH